MLKIFPNKLSSFIVFSIIFLIYGEAFCITIIGQKFRYYMSVVIILLLILYLLKNSKTAFKNTIYDAFPIRYTVLAIFIMAISIPFWSTSYNIYSYLGIPLAYLAYKIDYKELNNLIIFIAVLTFIMTFYEYVTGHYLFINTIENTELDEVFFGGAVGVFRAKGLFYGPLSAGVFMTIAYFLNYKKKWLVFICFVTCFFCNSRTGLVLLLIPIIYMIVKNFHHSFIIIILLLIISVVCVNYISDDVITSVNRITALHEKGSQDVRLMYWVAGINQYFNYPMLNLIFGNNGLFRLNFHNNPESGWICLLTDNGLIGFFFYLYPFFYSFISFLKKRSYYSLLILCLFFVLNFITTAHLSGSSNFVFWILVFELYNKAKYGFNKSDIYYQTKR